MKRVGIYARVSTLEQAAENQVRVLREFVAARAWTAVEYVDQGQSGAKEKRPALDELLADVRRRKVDVVVCTKLDRLARSVRQLVGLAVELEVLAVDLVVLEQAIDTTTPAGKLLFHVLAAIAEFERSLIVDRVRMGIARAKAAGVRFGRPRAVVDVRKAAAGLAAGRSLRSVALELKVPPSTLSAKLRAARNP